ncbi:MAG: Smr/MutS family protein [Fluviicola sp.]|nr:Smr/MutS family protein [Fluviicola sp.]
MRFSPGQKIVFLHESGGGVVDSITENGRVVILDEDGFKKEYLKSQLALVQDEIYPVEDEVAINIELQDKNLDASKGRNTYSAERKLNDIPEIDLHIEELTESHKGLSNHEILSRQMIAFRQFYQRAKSQKKKKIVIIHGVGEGVLRYEVRSFLNKEDGVEYYDADYLDYGQGATVIEM